MIVLTREELDEFKHSLIRQRIRALLAGDLTGRKLVAAQQILAYIGHERWFPDCPLAATARAVLHR